MRVLHVITDTDRRGAQVFAIDLGEALVQLGHEVRTVALAPGNRSAKLDVHVLGHRARGLGTLRRLRRQMSDADITIAHGSSTLLACSVAGLGRGRPFVYRQISESLFWARTRLRRARVRLYLRYPRRVVALSAGAAQTLSQHLGVAPSRLDVVPNGVPIRTFTPASPDDRTRCREQFGLPRDAFIALFIGALAPEKGARVAIEALAHAPDVHLAVAGDGPEMGELVRTAQQQAPDRVHFLGELTDTLPAYQASDIAVLPSLGGDSMPATLIEAGFCRLPAVSTPIGSIADIVVDGRTGLLTAPGDSAALAEAMISLRDKTRADAMGRAAERHCRDRFEIGVVARGWETTLLNSIG
jgi:glycosyltransferase involved in cell wall biosynthesis